MHVLYAWCTKPDHEPVCMFLNHASLLDACQKRMFQELSGLASKEG